MLPVLALALALGAPPPPARAEPEVGPPAEAPSTEAAAPPGASDPPSRPAFEDLPERMNAARMLPRAGWLVAYRLDRQERGRSRSGTRPQSVGRVLQRGSDFAPLSQTREVHSLEVLHGIHERVTLGLEVPWVRVATRLDSGSGPGLDTRMNGFGDVRLSARARFLRNGRESLNLGVGLELPTGVTDMKDDFGAGRVRLPYDMQPGSGTWNLLPSLTYLGYHGPHTWGLHVGGHFFLGENHRDWSRGDRWFVGGFAARRWPGQITSSLWLEWSEFQDIVGRDRRIDPGQQPAADPDNYGGARLTGGAGLEVALPWLDGQRLGVEASWPLYQSLDGPQQVERWRLRAGLEWAF